MTIESFKIPTSKLQRNPKLQIPKTRDCLMLGALAKLGCFVFVALQLQHHAFDVFVFLMRQQ
jgi:hypothetical protein